METKLNYKSKKSNAPGTLFEKIDFVNNGKLIAPFNGGKFTLKPGATSKLDIHEVRECWIVAEGNGHLSINGESAKIISSGEFHFFESMHSHQVTNIGDTKLIIYSVWWNV